MARKKWLNAWRRRKRREKLEKAWGSLKASISRTIKSYNREKVLHLLYVLGISLLVFLFAYLGLRK